METENSKSALSLKPYRKWLSYFPPILLIFFSLLNFYNVQTENASPWMGGGFALHSTYDVSLFRFVRVYGIDSGGARHRLEARRSGLSNPFVYRPNASNARKLAFKLKSVNSAEVLKKYKSVQIELWQHTFEDGPKLGAEMIARHEVKTKR